MKPIFSHSAPSLLTCHEDSPGQMECSLNLDRLFSTNREYDRFRKYWPAFLASDPVNPEICRLDGNRLIYRSEHLVPTKTDRRPPLLIVLGNPAGHSVKAGMFFSFEANGKEHRFWQTIMRHSGLLDLADEDDVPIAERNQRRRDRILALDYTSPFRVGLAVFISLPSTASAPPWAGVAGVQKLIGTAPLRRLEAAERQRVLESAGNFFVPNGRVLAFQRNAWNALRSPDDPPYDLDLAKAGKLRGMVSGLPNVPLYGIPPTRLAGNACKVLRDLIGR